MVRINSKKTAKPLRNNICIAIDVSGSMQHLENKVTEVFSN
jgi:hypothetical protein